MGGWVGLGFAPVTHVEAIKDATKASRSEDIGRIIPSVFSQKF
jgi:hypothetical protein